MKKFLCIILTSILLIPNFVFADDEELVIEDTNLWSEIEEVSINPSKNPVLNSRSAVVIDRNTKTILFGKNEMNKCKMASTTKIMTAIITLENGNLNQMVEVSSKAARIGGSRLGLKKGDKITLNDLLYGLMLCSRQ